MDNTLRNAFQPHPQSTSTNNTPPATASPSTTRLRTTTSDTPTPSTTHPTPFRNQALPSTLPTKAQATSSAIPSSHIRDQTRNIPNETLSDTLPNTPLPHPWSGTKNTSHSLPAREHVKVKVTSTTWLCTRGTMDKFTLILLFWCWCLYNVSRYLRSGL